MKHPWISFSDWFLVISPLPPPEFNHHWQSIQHGPHSQAVIWHHMTGWRESRSSPLFGPERSAWCHNVIWRHMTSCDVIWPRTVWRESWPHHSLVRKDLLDVSVEEGHSQRLAVAAYFFSRSIWKRYDSRAIALDPFHLCNDKIQTTWSGVPSQSESSLSIRPWGKGEGGRGKGEGGRRALPPKQQLTSKRTGEDNEFLWPKIWCSVQRFESVLIYQPVNRI